MTLTNEKQEQLSNLITGEPIGWKTWYSVQNAPFPIVKVCPNLWENVYIYSNGNDFYGLITEQHILTKPIFAKHFRIIGDGIAVATMAVKGANNWGIVNLRSGKIMFKNFSTYMMVDDDKIAYRVDGDCRQWPNNMKWGVLSLPSCEKLMAPKAFPIIEDKDMCVPLRDRILAALA